MGFGTAIALSFSNLLTKKGRTIMTAVAGSIGIIGIAAILALANGVNNYIYNVESDTLSLYPLQIQSTGFDISSMISVNGSFGSSSGTSAYDTSAAPSASSDVGDTPVGERAVLSTIFSKVGANDLKSLKAYLDTNPEGLSDDVNDIEYSYDATPQFYSSSTKDIRQVSPSDAFSSLGIGVSGTIAGSIQSQVMGTSFRQMAADTSLYSAKYQVVDGRWPTAYNECIVVLTPSGEISDETLYQLGLRDPKELDKMVKDFSENKDVKVPADTKTYTYNDLMGVKMKLVYPTDVYRYNKTYKVWEDKSSDQKFMKALLKKAPTVKVVGVVKANDGVTSGTLASGVNYPAALTTKVMQHAAQSKIVQQQLAHPSVDVFTNKKFSVENDRSKDTNDFDMSKLITVDKTAIQKAFSVDPSKFDISAKDFKIDSSKLPKPDLKKLLPQSSVAAPTPKINSQAFGALMGTLITGYVTWCTANGKNPTDVQTNFALYARTAAAQQAIQTAMPKIIDTASLQKESQAYTAKLTAAIQKGLQSYMTQVSAAIELQLASEMKTTMSKLQSGFASALNVDPTQIAKAFKFNMTSDQLTSLVTSMMSTKQASYDDNLKTLGYATLDKPSEIDIYPKSFEAKDNIKQILDDYNNAQKTAGHDDKSITYSDLVGSLMSSVTQIINMISMVLIAFVSISLVVSSIMIGIITYISVLERKKEIGVLRAIGARKKDIRRVFNAETLIIGLLAGVIAILVVVLASIPVNAAVMAGFGVPNVMLLPWLSALILIILSCFLTFVGGLIPSTAASHRDPVEALRSE
jgi:ABC-type antimicrobial peptide transport system permease subunit